MAIRDISNEQAQKKLLQLLLDNRSRAEVIKQDLVEIKVELNQIPLPACTEREKHFHALSMRTLSLVERLVALDEGYEKFLERTKASDSVKLFTVYFKNGQRRVIGGITIDDAYRRAKMNPNRVHTIEWCDEGVTMFRYDFKKKLWKKDKV